MKKILAFGASSSKKSINRKFALYAASKLEDVEVVSIDLNDYEMKLYSVDKEVDGIPEPAVKFKKILAEADGVIISFAEHNGTYTSVFKNLFDWASRVEKSMWLNKPMLLLATSPGSRGGEKGLEIAVERFQYMDGNVIAHFSLPHFHANFSEESGVTEEELAKSFSEALNRFEKAI